MVLEKTLESPLDSKEVKPVNPKGNQLWIFTGRTMLKLKLQSFGHLIWRADSLEKTLMLGKIEGGRRGDDREWEGWMASPTQWTWVWANSRRWWRTGSLAWCSPWGHRVRHEWVTEEQPPPLRQLHDWTGFNQRPSNSWFCFCPYPTPKSQKDYYAADLYPNSKSLEPFNVSWKWTIIGGMLNLFCFSGSELPDFSCQENWYWRVHSRRAFTNSLDDL